MKRETLIKVIDEEFGDDKEISWLIDVVQKAFQKNDGRITECTNRYEERVAKTIDYLSELREELISMEKEEIKDGVRIAHKRKENKPNA